MSSENRIEHDQSRVQHDLNNYYNIYLKIYNLSLIEQKSIGFGGRFLSSPDHRFYIVIT